MVVTGVKGVAGRVMTSLEKEKGRTIFMRAGTRAHYFDVWHALR
ncbi:MAG: hypothetical protein ACXU7D_05155 [Burkholderiaceae bacterium]